MQYTETDSKIRVSIPYELKDAFKSVFKTAKWNRDYKEWEIAVTAKQKLIKWLELSKDLTEQLDSQKALEESIDMSEGELNRLKNQFIELKSTLKSQQELVERFNKINADIEQVKGDIASTEQVVIAEKAKAHAAFNKTQEQVDKIIDVKQILAARQTMIYTYKHVGSTEKGRYTTAQNTIYKAIQDLAKAGLESRGLDKLYYMNFNRPDRDNPNSVTIEDIYTISIHQPTED